jgi:hypothetical protein
MATSEAKEGYVNRNNQRLAAKTDRPGTDPNHVWHLQCESCGLQYGAKELDFLLRKCPGCQGGAPGVAN